MVDDGTGTAMVEVTEGSRDESCEPVHPVANAIDATNATVMRPTPNKPARKRTMSDGGIHVVAIHRAFILVEVTHQSCWLAPAFERAIKGVDHQLAPTGTELERENDPGPTISARQRSTVSALSIAVLLVALLVIATVVTVVIIRKRRVGRVLLTKPGTTTAERLPQ